MGHHRDGVEALVHAIHATPIIDNHAHPLLTRAAIHKHPLLAVATEAQDGASLAASRTGLAHLRAVNQLSRVLGCAPTWDAVAAAIEERRAGRERYEQWTARCLEGVQCVLVDDGLDAGDEVEGYAHFDRFTPGRSKRIVRIEQFIPRLVEGACLEHGTVARAFQSVVDGFRDVVVKAIADPEVVGFKSVICYRTGLAIPGGLDAETALGVFKDIFEQRRGPKGTEFTRLNHRGLNEYFVHLLAGLIRDSGGPHPKPIQFHTGLGDNDITLTKSSPAHMQAFIAAYPAVPVVLLHSGYPFVRETGYLAAMYANAHADVGEVFPFLSRDGQEGVVRQILELCPASKVLWSTDGHWFPETYLLAVGQVREVLATVLGDYVRKGDVSCAQATRLVEDVLFNNSNKLYNLGLELKRSAVDVPTLPLTPNDKLQTLSRFLEGHDCPQFLRIYWNDMTAQSRMKIVPMRRVLATLRAGEDVTLGVTKAGLGLLQTDVPVAGVSPSGEYRLHPDLSSLRRGPRAGHVSAVGDFREQDGSPVALCPRTALKRVLRAAEERLGAEVTLGFEIELVLLRRAGGAYAPLDGDGHAWCVSRAMEHEAAAGVIEEAVALLGAAGIYVELVHPESSNGQYEVVLPRAPALRAVDTLVLAREVLSSRATAAGLRMTLHPKPFADAAGTGAHMHISLAPSTGHGAAADADGGTARRFYGGVLRHLRAVCAFTYGGGASYARAVDGVWAGGTWVAWGTQNRETPLRRVAGSHWEMKAVDGLANPYLAAAAVVAAGITAPPASGAEDEGPDRPGGLADCGEAGPAGLGEEGRRARGVVERMPGGVAEALGALEGDGELCEVLGRELVERYVVVKRAEEEMLAGMGEGERRRWLLERY